MKDLNKKIFSGAVTMVLLRFFIKFIGLISTVILARLISPEDFGLVAIVMSIYALIEMMKAFGFDVVLIQKANPSNEMFNTTWTIQLIFGVISSIIMLSIAPFIANSFNDPRLEDLARVIALLFLINGFVNIGIVTFRKELDFKREFLYMSIPKVCAVITTISVAIIYKSYWALICGMFTSSLSQAVLSYVFSKYRPRFCLSEVKGIFSFSSWLLLGSLINYANIRLKDLIVGNMLGAKFTGYVSVGDEIASLPTTEMVAAINRATYPGYAKISDDNHALKMLYINALSFIALLGIPASIGLSLSAPFLVPVMLGEQWIEIVPLIQILGIAYAFICINSNAAYIYLAKGKPKVSTLIALFRAIVLISIMVLAIDIFGMIGVGYAVLATSLLMFPVYYLFLRQEIPLPVMDYLSILWRPAFASLAMYVTSSQMFFNTSNDLVTMPALKLIALIAFSIIIYITTIIVLWLLSGRPKSVESLIINRISSRSKS